MVVSAASGLTSIVGITSSTALASESRVDSTGASSQSAEVKLAVVLGNEPGRDVGAVVEQFSTDDEGIELLETILHCFRAVHWLLEHSQAGDKRSKRRTWSFDESLHDRCS